MLSWARFTFTKETHYEARTGVSYNVHIHPSVSKIIEGQLSVKEDLCALTHKLVFESVGDVAFYRTAKSSEELFIWYNFKRDNIVRWFTLPEAKNYFGSEFAERFGHVERQEWSREVAV